jgi:hypothetical protein
VLEASDALARSRTAKVPDWRSTAIGEADSIDFEYPVKGALLRTSLVERIPRKSMCIRVSYTTITCPAFIPGPTVCQLLSHENDRVTISGRLREILDAPRRKRPSLVGERRKPGTKRRGQVVKSAILPSSDRCCIARPDPSLPSGLRSPPWVRRKSAYNAFHNPKLGAKGEYERCDDLEELDVAARSSVQGRLLYKALGMALNCPV